MGRTYQSRKYIVLTAKDLTISLPWINKSSLYIVWTAMDLSSYVKLLGALLIKYTLYEGLYDSQYTSYIVRSTVGPAN